METPSVNTTETLIARIYEHLKDIEKVFKVQVLTEEEHSRFKEFTEQK